MRIATVALLSLLVVLVFWRSDADEDPESNPSNGSASADGHEVGSRETESVSTAVADAESDSTLDPSSIEPPNVTGQRLQVDGSSDLDHSGEDELHLHLLDHRSQPIDSFTVFLWGPADAADLARTSTASAVASVEASLEGTAMAVDDRGRWSAPVALSAASPDRSVTLHLAETASPRGFVAESVTEKRLVGARFQARRVDLPDAVLAAAAELGAPCELATETDGSGEFTLPEVPSGTYVFTASAERHETASYEEPFDVSDPYLGGFLLSALHSLTVELLGSTVDPARYSVSVGVTSPRSTFDSSARSSIDLPRDGARVSLIVWHENGEHRVVRKEGSARELDPLQVRVEGERQIEVSLDGSWNEVPDALIEVCCRDARDAAVRINVPVDGPGPYTIDGLDVREVTVSLVQAIDGWPHHHVSQWVTLSEDTTRVVMDVPGERSRLRLVSPENEPYAGAYVALGTTENQVAWTAAAHTDDEGLVRIPYAERPDLRVSGFFQEPGMFVDHRLPPTSGHSRELLLVLEDPIPTTLELQGAAGPIEYLDIRVTGVHLERPLNQWLTDATGRVQFGLVPGGEPVMYVASEGYWETDRRIPIRPGPNTLHLHRLGDVVARLPAAADPDSLVLTHRATGASFGPAHPSARYRCTTAREGTRTLVRLEGLPEGEHDWSVARDGAPALEGSVAVAPGAATALDL